MRNNISISGAKGSGKSYLAKQILTKGNYVTLSFASGLKTLLADILGEHNNHRQLYEALYGQNKGNSYLFTRNISHNLVEFHLGLETSNKLLKWMEANIPDVATGRQLLQGIGTDFFRDQVSETYWVDRMAANIAKIPPHQRIVVDDTRFLDEFKLLETLGFTMVCVVDPTQLEYDSHKSEQSINPNKFSYIIKNDKKPETIINFVEKYL